MCNTTKHVIPANINRRPPLLSAPRDSTDISLSSTQGTMTPPCCQQRCRHRDTTVCSEDGTNDISQGVNRLNRRVTLLFGLWVVVLLDLSLNIYKKCSVSRFLRATTETQEFFVAPTIIRWDGFAPMENFIAKYYDGYNVFCHEIDDARANSTDSSHPVVVNISFGCDEQFKASGYGTGNFISWFYGIRTAAQVYENVDLQLSCHDADTSKNNLILPWLTGYFPGRPVGSANPYPMVSIEDACKDYAAVPMAYMYRQLQQDMRRMAISLVGVPSADHPSAAFAEKHLWTQQQIRHDSQQPSFQLPNPQRMDEPVYPKGSIALDDAVIHFRCGDLMDSEHPFFAFLKFSALTKFVSPAARTIGIITQPFESGGQARIMDSGSTVHDRCSTVVLSLVEYIQERHPNSRISIHNGRNETIALAYARMIMANETIAGVSTFGVFPVMSTFGVGTLRNAALPGHSFANEWTFNPRLDSLVDNLSIVEEQELMMAADIKKLWETEGERGVLAWFRDEPSEEQQ